MKEGWHIIENVLVNAVFVDKNSSPKDDIDRKKAVQQNSTLCVKYLQSTFTERATTENKNIL